MAVRRIAYGLVLALALLFRILYVGYFSFFILALVLCLPGLALLVSLPAMLACSLRLAPSALQVERGGGAVWRFRAAGGFRLPLARLTLALQLENRLTGAKGTGRLHFSGASMGAVQETCADTAHCGKLTLTVLSVRVYDCLGLFSLRRPCPPAASLYVLPLRVEPDTLPMPGEEMPGSVSLRPRPGGGPGEDYDLRPYRAGDPMRAVHWKLSSKRDELVVKETLEPRRAALVLTFDHFGPIETLDAVLDRLFSLSGLLLEKGRPHFIQWAEPYSGALRSFEVSGERALAACRAAALSDPCPPSGKSVLDSPIRAGDGGAPPRRLHLTAGEEDAP